MIALDGKFYQIKSDGIVYPAKAEMKTPFAVVTNFMADTSFQITDHLTYNQLNELIDQLIPSKNIFYAIKVEGQFNQVITRSVPKQQKPYPDLIEVVKDQPLFQINSERGIMVGFRVPEYMEGINVPAYHYHFMNEEKSKGGHLLECVLSDVTISIDIIHEAQVGLLNTETFYQLNLLKDRSEESEIVER
jgi:acetolactate decarboxylase